MLQFGIKNIFLLPIKTITMKVLQFLTLTLFIFFTSCDSGPRKAVIETEYGNMTVELYDSTPLHRDNFVKLVSEGFYDDLLFHRVIEGFMIQGGDPESKNADASKRLGGGGPGYTIPAEIGSPHFKGTLAAARTGDAMNPERASSGSQFYLVQGKPLTETEVKSFASRGGYTYNPTQIKKYVEMGGTPGLDNQYTVFGEVIDGIEVIDKIAAVQTRPGDRPIKDLKMKIRMLN
jgi:peptidyl-prolyl cis-trans isomerase B (cyclophilin B)